MRYAVRSGTSSAPEPTTRTDRFDGPEKPEQIDLFEEASSAPAPSTRTARSDHSEAKKPVGNDPSPVPKWAIGIAAVVVGLLLVAILHNLLDNATSPEAASTDRSVSPSGVPATAEPALPPIELQSLKGRQASALSSAPPPTQPAVQWYAISNNTTNRACVSSDGPAKMIQNHQVLDLPYRARDTMENGVVVEVTIESPSYASKVTYYRGKARCEAALMTVRQQRQQEIERYQ